MTRGQPKIVVVGAGLAGLRCAERLGSGVDVVVLEARDRVGGRCWSSPGWDAGQVGEHGGELIEAGQTSVLGVVAELGLTLESRTEGPCAVRMLLADEVRDASDVGGLSTALERLATELLAVGPVSYRDPSRALRELDDLTVHDWIEANIEGGVASDLGASMALVVRLNLGFDPRALSAVSLIHMWLGLPEIDDVESGFRFGNEAGSRTDEPVTFADVAGAGVVDVQHVAGGNDLIAVGLADRLPAGALRLSSPVSAVVRESDGRYSVSVVGEPSIGEVDHVVLAVPLPVLGDMDLTGAGLSPLRHRAIADVGMGSNTKLLLQVDASPSSLVGWPGVVVADEPAVALWDGGRGQLGDAGVLTVFTADRAFASPDGAHGPADAESRHRLERLLDRVAPGLSGHCTGDVWLDSWPDDPWARGSYAGFGPGQYSRYAGFLGQPEGGIHFAGEHTSLASPGYLDGAVASGERAAREVLDALGRVSPG